MDNRLYILCGIPFSGKSTLASILAEKLNFVRIDLDDIKFELYGSQIKDEELEQKDWDKVYQEMYRRIENTLKKGKTVIHDTGNFTKHERNLVKMIADKLNIPTRTIFIDIPESIAYNRLLENRKTKKRFDVSDEEFKASVAEMEPPTHDENPLIFKYNDSANDWFQKNLALA